MESGTGAGIQRRAIFKEDSWFSQFRNGSNPWMARYVYALIFLVANLLAWVVRDYSSAALTEMENNLFFTREIDLQTLLAHYVTGCNANPHLVGDSGAELKNCQGGHHCLGAQGVLRVSLGCFVFYIIMFLLTAGTSKLHGTRDLWHSGWWSAKIVLWIALTIIPFLLPSSFIQLYGEIAHFGAGEPAGETCNRKAEASNKTDWLTIISFVVALLAIVIATFSTGIDSQCFQLRKSESPAEDDVPYGYGFFHFVFATGAMYFAMLLIGWNTHHTIRKWTIDVGWTSTWVRIVNEWLAVCVYLWMLVAPVILKSSRAAEPV
ncbi:hypothetical protein KPL71_000693 [Citrus sinensis]|uniref:Uncharacterized protein n=1 Tax=Citrus sinensis TaxID=2711 RepID=A0ACB8NRS6_CITSI|nr:hypothetical protein KPL71_000693 [Citrus sinensis]